MKLTTKNYVERDVSWMHFNHRILVQAQRSDIPLMERLKFLGIYSNNLDEFFRVRVATLNRILEYTGKSGSLLQKKSAATLKTITKLNSQYVNEFEEAMYNITQALHHENIHLIKDSELSPEQEAYVMEFFRSQIKGLISPVWLSAAKSFTTSSDDALYLAIRMQHWREDRKKPDRDYAIIELPVKQIGRFVVLPDTMVEGQNHRNVMFLDDVIRIALTRMFPGTPYNHFEAWSFKMTKDAEMELDADIRGGKLQRIAKGVKSRKNGLPVRFVYDKLMPRNLLRRLLEKMGLSQVDTMVPAGRYHNHKDLMRFPNMGAVSSQGTPLEFPAWPAIIPSWAQQDSLLKAIREKDRFLNVPYHSFEVYVNLLREAAVNPEVKSIKTTLYRLAKDSKVVGALIAAARNGKKVTVVIELLARFDEESNIDWSKKMSDAGVQVIMGVEGLKVHSKITLIGTKNQDIAVISTGNFHEGNAKAYTDFLLLTASKAITSDVSKVFSFIEKPYLPVRFKQLLVSPNDIRRKLTGLIEQEITNHRKGLPAQILCKLNHVTDEEIVQKLYDAAASGVKVNLLVRGNCSLVQDQPALNENLTVHAIIDRYLEHSRILVFANGCDLDLTTVSASSMDFLVYIGSADWMPRNLDHRIEVYTRVEDVSIKLQAKKIIEYGMRNNQDGFRSQEELYQQYQNEERIHP